MEAAASAKQSKLATAKAKNIRKTEQTTAKPKKIRKTEQKQDIHTERHLDHLALEGILRRQSRLDRSAIQRSIQSTVATEKVEAGVHDLASILLSNAACLCQKKAPQFVGAKPTLMVVPAADKLDQGQTV